MRAAPLSTLFSCVKYTRKAVVLSIGAGYIFLPNGIEQALLHPQQLRHGQSFLGEARVGDLLDAVVHEPAKDRQFVRSGGDEATALGHIQVPDAPGEEAAGRPGGHGLVVSDKEAHAAGSAEVSKSPLLKPCRLDRVGAPGELVEEDQAKAGLYGPGGGVRRHELPAEGGKALSAVLPLPPDKAQTVEEGHGRPLCKGEQTAMNEKIAAALAQLDAERAEP